MKFIIRRDTQQQRFLVSKFTDDPTWEAPCSTFGEARRLCREIVRKLGGQGIIIKKHKICIQGNHEEYIIKVC